MELNDAMQLLSSTIDHVGKIWNLAITLETSKLWMVWSLVSFCDGWRPLEWTHSSLFLCLTYKSYCVF